MGEGRWVCVFGVNWVELVSSVVVDTVNIQQVKFLIQMDTIQRVDTLIRKNILKHTQKKYEELYRSQLQQRQKQRKRDALKSYTQIIKEANRKAVEKNKAKSKKNRKNNKVFVKKEGYLDGDQGVYQNGEESGRDCEGNGRNRMGESERKRVEEAIQERAQRIMQEMELQKLDKCLAAEKKKTKLYELNDKCRRLAKSSAKIASSQKTFIPQERKQILEQFERKAMQEIQQLDNIIDKIVTGQHKQTQPVYKNFQHPVRAVSAGKPAIECRYPKPENLEVEDHGTVKDPLLSPIFFKSSEELLSLEYIPL